MEARSRSTTSTRARSTWRRNWWPSPRPSEAPSMRPGMSATTNSRVAGADDAEVGHQRREGVVGDLGLGRRDGRDEGRLAGVGEPDEGDVGDEPQLEARASAPRRTRPARRSPGPGGRWTGSGRCPARPVRPGRPGRGRRRGRGRPGPRRPGPGRSSPRGRRRSGRRRSAPCLRLLPSRGRRRRPGGGDGPGRRSARRRCGRPRSQTSPPLPPSPPSGPPRSTYGSRRNGDRAGPAVAAPQVDHRLVGEFSHHGEG